MAQINFFGYVIFHVIMMGATIVFSSIAGIDVCQQVGAHADTSKWLCVGPFADFLSSKPPPPSQSGSVLATMGNALPALGRVLIGIWNVLTVNYAILNAEGILGAPGFIARIIGTVATGKLLYDLFKALRGVA